MTFSFRYIKPVADTAFTLLLWAYFTVGYICFFSLFYVLAFIFSRNREHSFQKLNHIFYKIFFLLVRAIPRLKLRIQDEVLSLRSCVIVSNHISYLDPILLISLFEKHKTVVKSIFFRLPVFGQVMKYSGYVPSDGRGELSLLMADSLEKMGNYLSSGGNLFIFPEGTRSRDGRIGPFSKGAFKIAKRCHAPIKVLFIKNTDKLFCPGNFLFNTCVRNTVEVELIGSLEPDYENRTFSISELTEQVRTLMSKTSGLKSEK